MNRRILIFLMILVPFICWGASYHGALYHTADTPDNSGTTNAPGVTAFSAEQAIRVDLALKQIAKKKRVTPLLRKLTFSQDELNAYLNLIYTKQYAPEVEYIHLKLGQNNSISGVMHIQLDAGEYAQVPEFLRNIKIDFCGQIESENSRMRYLFETLKINGANFTPDLLDQAFSAAQSDTKNKKSLFDWFDLLPGLKKLIVHEKEITLFY